MSLIRFNPTPSDRMAALWLMLTFEDAVVLEYGPMGTTCFAERALKGMELKVNRLFSTHLSEDDVVMGDVTRLEKALTAIDRDLQPKVIFVVPSAILTVTGADIAGVCHYMQSEVNAKLIAYEGGGFKGDYSTGLADVYTLLTKELAGGESTPVPGTYNILGACAYAYKIQPDLQELEHLMDSAFGAKRLATLGLGDSTQDMKALGQASVNLVIRAEALPAAKWLKENFGTESGYKTVVAFGKEKESVECLAEVSEKLRANSIWARVWGSILGPITNFLANCQYVLFAGIGGYLMISGKSAITIGSIQAMLVYSKKLSHPINMVTNQYANILTALAGAERIFEILDSPDETNEGKKDFQVEQVKGAIDFQNIRFGYVPGEPVLKKLNLSVKPGQKIAIVGATGSGKTTIVNLLTRFYELDSGSILIDGVNITDIPKDRLRKSIAIVLQDTVLFKDTILANIAFGNPDADEAQVKKAAVMAMADHFIERLPDGYHTELTQSGSNLSTGQRQLLAIARAILAEPKILILDEATSSVDTRTEIQIQQAMANLMKGRTSLIIAHRISTIRDADAIVVVKDGVIAECGNHEELLRLDGNYYNLCKNQYGNVG